MPGDPSWNSCSGRCRSGHRAAAAIAEFDAALGVDPKHVDALHGEYDEVSMREWSEVIVATINAAHPGRVRYREFPGLDHCSSYHATRGGESVGRCGAGEFVADPDDAIVAFLQAHS